MEIEFFERFCTELQVRGNSTGTYMWNQQAMNAPEMVQDWARRACEKDSSMGLRQGAQQAIDFLVALMALEGTCVVTKTFLERLRLKNLQDISCDETQS